MYKIINWYTKRFKFPRRGWKFGRFILKGTGLLRKTYCKKLPNGSFIYTRPVDHIQQQLFWYGYYEKNAILTWERFVTDKAVVLDIGANIGYYSIIAAPKAKTVYAFEPSPAAASLLEKNIDLNQFINIIVVKKAVAEKSGDLDLFLSSETNTGMSGLMQPENFSGEQLRVQSINMDEWIGNNHTGKIDLVKIDVEGAELQVLKGMTNIILDKPVFFIEIAGTLLKKMGDQPADIYSFFSKAGYIAYLPTAPGILEQVDKITEADSVIFMPAGKTLPAEIGIV